MSTVAGNSEGFGFLHGARLVGSAVVVVAVAIGYVYTTWLQSDVLIYVDNPSAQAVDVSVDGGSPLTVPAGHWGELWCRAGERTLTAASEGVPLGSQRVQIVPGPARTYIWNPTATARYGVMTVYYGIGGPETWLPDQDASAQDRTLAGQIAIQSAQAWHDLEPCDFVFASAGAQRKISAQEQKGRFNIGMGTNRVLQILSEDEVAFLVQQRDARPFDPAAHERLHDLLERFRPRKR